MDAEKTGSFLAALRKQKGLTQQEISGVLNISNKTISKWEQGGGYPEITMLPLIAKLYDVTVDELIAGERLVNEGSTNLQGTDERKKYLLMTSEMKFNAFYAAALVASFLGLLGKCVFSSAPIIYISSAVGLILLLVGLIFSMTPLRIYSQIFGAGDLYALKRKTYQKVFLFATVFIFAVENLFFSIIFNAYNAFYAAAEMPFPNELLTELLVVIILSVLWVILQLRLSAVKKGSLLFPKAIGFIAAFLGILKLTNSVIFWLYIKYWIGNAGFYKGSVYCFILEALEFLIIATISAGVLIKRKKALSEIF